MAALLCAKNLCKTYVIDKRQNNVLRNVNLQVNEGDMVAIMGHFGFRKIHAFVCNIRDGSCNRRTGAF